jgi:hypothetical protein
MAWYRDPKNKAGRIIYRHKTMDFGDAASALIVRITQKKAKSQTCEGLGMKCKMARQSTSIRDKDVLALGAPITDQAHSAEMEILFKSKMSDIRMNQKQNLFDPIKEYLMGNSPIEEKMFARVISKRDKIKGGLHHLTYIIKARCRMKNKSTRTETIQT